MLLLLIFAELTIPSILQVPADVSTSSQSSSPLDANPNFAGPIVNVTVAMGREAVLSCIVTELGTYKVGWMKADDQTILSLHTRVITHNPRITVTHDHQLKTWQLRIRQLKETDGGCYMCQINTNSMKKTIGCIDVQVPPDIDDAATSADMTISEGDNVTLICQATGHPKPRILWRREDGGRMMHNAKTTEADVDTFSGSSLTLIRVDRRQSGAYLCIASNDVPPAVSKRITLNINFPPSIQVMKPLVGAAVGADAKLKCDVEAFPNAINYWIKDDDANILNSQRHSIQERRTSNSGNPNKVIMVLLIRNIESSDYGTYRCFSSNPSGKADGSVRLFEVKIAPTTTTTTTTTTSTTTPPPTTSTELSTRSSLLGNKNNDPEVQLIHHQLGSSVEDEPVENWLFPSVAPAPLELETIAASTSNPRRFSGNFLGLLSLVASASIITR